jgi:RimJ/RimL family protein N-acetyltransferase
MVISQAIMRGQIQLHTERLLLRKLRRSDIPALVPLIGASEVAATTLRIPHPYSEADGHAYLRLLARHRKPWFGIFHFRSGLRESEQLCGGVGLSPEPDHGRAEIGYWIGVPFWGKGIASEAAREMIRYGFEDLGLNRIFANVYSGNAASQRVLEKLGMKYEGRFRKHVKKWGEYRDTENYGLLADEWKAQRL